MSFTTVELGDVAKFIRGITFKPTDKVENHSAGSVVCFRTKNVQQLLTQDDLVSVPAKFVKRAEQYISEGDILVSTANSWNLVGKCCWIPKLDYKATLGGFISAIRPISDNLFPRYLYHWFNSPYTQLLARHCGRQTTNISNMDIHRCLKLKIPLPPLAEQKRIAAVLDKAAELRTKRQQAIDKLDTLLQSVFLDMFGDPVTNPMGYQVTSLADVCKRITDGTHQSPKWVESGVPFLFVSNVVAGELTFDTKKFISIETYQELNSRCPVELNDILYTIVGSYGNSAKVKTNRPFSFQRHIAHIKPDHQKINVDYLLGAMQSISTKRQADRLARGVAQKTLNLRELKTISILNPPFDVQGKFADIRIQIQEEKLIMMKSLDQNESFFNSLQQRAFRGEL